MNSEQLARLTENNQSQMLDNCSTFQNVRFRNEEFFSSISLPRYAWPNLVYDLKQDANVLHLINEGIEKDNLPPYLALQNPDMQTLALLSSLRMRPVLKWKTMVLNLKEIKLSIINKTFEALSLSYNTNFADFTHVVSTNLFNRKPLNSELFEHLVSKGNTQIITAYQQDKAIATLLSFNQNNIAGIYMVAVDKEYRGQGYAKKLMTEAIIASKKAGMEYCVLQSTADGFGLYQSLGFQVVGEMVICWKVGKI